MGNPITPTVGRIVLFKSTDPANVGNGANEVPAIVTRVWSDTCINCTVFRDAASPVAVTSVVYTDDFEASGQGVGWRWMDYQVAQAAKHAAEV